MLLRVLSTAFSVLILIVASLIPYIGLQSQRLRNSKLFCLTANLSAFTCFSCGVFLSTVFLGLIPHLNENERTIRAQINATNPQLLAKYELILNSNLMIMIGFLLIVLIEQSVFFCMPEPSSPTSNNRASRRSDTNHAETHLNIQTDNQPLVRFNSSETDSDSDGGVGRIEFRTVTPNRSENNNGHAHSHDHHSFIPTGSFIQSFILLFALSVHSIFEGIALGAQKNDADFIKFLIAIMMHEVLCSFAYGVKLTKNNVSLRVALLSIVFLSVTLPIGVTIMSFFVNATNLSTIIAKFVLEGFAAGILIYVATVEMLADELNHHHSSQGFIKGLALSSGAFIFYVFNYLIHV